MIASALILIPDTGPYLVGIVWTHTFCSPIGWSSGSCT